MMEQLEQIHLEESRPGRDYNYPSSGSKGYAVEAHITEIVIMAVKIPSVRLHTSQGPTMLNLMMHMVMMILALMPMRKLAIMMRR